MEKSWSHPTGLKQCLPWKGQLIQTVRPADTGNTLVDDAHYRVLQNSVLLLFSIYFLAIVGGAERILKCQSLQVSDKYPATEGRNSSKLLHGGSNQ